MTIINVLLESIKKAESRGYVCKFDLSFEKGRLINSNSYYAVIFDKEFCKFIWGEEKAALPFYGDSPIAEECILWSWHLKQMVVSENPIEYLKNNLNKDSWDKVFNS